MKRAESDRWRKVRLKEVCEKITVGHVGPMVNEYVDSGIPFLRSQNIQPFKLNVSEMKYITPEFHKKLSKSALRPGDVAIVRTGYPGTAAVIPNRFPDLNCADLVIARPATHLLDPWYLTCIFNSTWGRGAVAGNLVGVAQQHFNVTAAKEMEVLLPDLPIQRRIASILSAYDDLIENNTRRIAILEEMARRIYEEWFVRFRFPGHEQVKMVESELGLIPEGWSTHLKDLLISSLGGDWGGDSPMNEETEPVIVIRGTDFEDCQQGTQPRSPLRYISSSSLAKRALQAGDVVVENSINSKSRTAGKPLLVTTGLLKRLGVSAIAASFCKVFRLKNPECAPLLYLKMKRQFELGEMAFYQNVAANGIANFQSGRYIDKEAVLIPKEATHHALLDTLATLTRTSAVYADKNFNLRTTRDLLLPKLISGELDVSTLPEPEEPMAA